MSILCVNRSKTKHCVLHNGTITWNSLPDIFKVNLSFSKFKRPTKFLSEKILENIVAGRHYDCLFFLLKCMKLRFFKCNCFWFWVFFAVKFPIISFVVIIRIIRNVIVSWISSRQVKLLSRNELIIIRKFIRCLVI